MGSGVSGAEHQAAATASGGMSAPARRWDGAETTRIGGPAGPSGSFRGPRPLLRTSGVPASVPVPASGPARPSAHVPGLPFHGAGS